MWTFYRYFWFKNDTLNWDDVIYYSRYNGIQFTLTERKEAYFKYTEINSGNFPTIFEITFLELNKIKGKRIYLCPPNKNEYFIGTRTNFKFP